MTRPYKTTRQYKTNPGTETIVFNGIRFHRRPDSKHKHHRRYYWPHDSHRKRGVGALHVEIWKFHNGTIPKGNHIHHIDGNTLNNDINNLACLTPAEHGAAHVGDPNRHSNRGRVLPRIHESKCAQCGKNFKSKHRSGAKYCSQNCESKYSRVNKLHHEQRPCPVCGTTFIYDKHAHRPLTCSRVCGQAARTDRRAKPRALAKSEG